jgi:hypothetical protein
MNWPFLFLALGGGLFPLAMIAWVLFLAPTGEAEADRLRQARRETLGAALRRASGGLAAGFGAKVGAMIGTAVGAVRAAGAARLARRVDG